MKKILTALAIASLSVTPAMAAKKEHTFSRPVASDLVSRMFVWWNAAFKDPEGFTPEAFGQYFTDDAVMRINGTNRAKGLTDLAARFRKIQSSVDAVEIKVPFVEAFSSPDGKRIFTYHLESAIENGKESHSMVMGYVEVRGGKIALVNFLSMEGQPGPIEMMP
ncbi:nuclear transport factor 2 family protein [Sphingobium boeckii]|uniref:Limonene-1,2-epoxide hydrolase n=1 Tax=Sphingobium boeckii TaxID=1082345 RepID=A0A7W9AK06_9SPHN|nr:nuclear transport factor 2 family protein [Sphingobium boeckii]MBB5686877.1 limonene-1,2-epoxide hydrolase [Sphingobium boeckii]